LSVEAREPRETEQVWKRQLADAIKEADRIVITQVGQHTPETASLWQIRGRKHIESFLSLLEIEDAKSNVVDGCDGDSHSMSTCALPNETGTFDRS
jgi:hypothetical protein